MHTITLASANAVAAIAAKLGSVEVFCLEDENGTWILTVPDNLAGQADALAASPPAFPVDLIGYAKAKQAALLAAGGTVNVAAAGAAPINVLCDGTSATRADLALLALFGQQSPTGTKLWLDNNGIATTLTGTQLVALATSIGTWVDNTYATLGTVLAGIAATPATITTTAQVDAAFAADTKA